MSFSIEQIQPSLYRIVVHGLVDEAIMSDLYKQITTVLMLNQAPVDFLVDITDFSGIQGSGQDLATRIGNHPQLGVMVFYGFNTTAARVVVRLQRRIRHRAFFFPTESQANTYVRVLRRRRKSRTAPTL